MRGRLVIDIDLNELSVEELKKLQGSIGKAISTFEERRRKEALAAAEAIARTFGYSLEDLAILRTPKPAERPAKYRSPEDRTLQWSGRGRQPAWFKQAIEAGANVEDLLAEKSG